ncbi:MAG: glycoside hydrolase family 3 C-terminal domain-containing protein [Clostridiales bacterium]|nr:glycoside hydrolase family 3 C-terminal domain-containing protein [Clostridiales bacterium]
MTKEALKALLDGMTLEEKAGQLTQCNAGQFIRVDAEITGPEGQPLPADALNRVMGSVLTFENAKQARQLQDMHLAADRNRIPLLLMVDVIHGMKTTYPIPLAMGCSFDDDLLAECAGMARREAAAAGVHVTFNPMVDTARDARWGRILETSSEEPLINGRMGAALVRATQGDDLSDPDNIACCVKHYAAYGAGEAGRDYNAVEISERALRESYLPAYKACVDAGARLVMPSFNALNGIPSVANKWLMNTVLRDEWGFDGVVISDYDAVGELVTHGVAADMKEAACLAMEAGCDIDMVKGVYYQHLADLVREGRIPEKALDDAVMRVLELKNDLGLFENPYHGADKEAEKRLNLCPAHREIARRAAEESAVLLKNEGVLPLKQDLHTLALIGPFAEEKRLNGFWSRPGAEAYTVTLPEGIRDRMPDLELVIARGCGAELGDTDTAGIAAAAEAARGAEAVVLCLGEPENDSGEGRSRTEVTLPGPQLALAEAVIRANPNTAVVLFNGRPLVLTELEKIAPAILEMWYPGTEAGHALARLLWGDANPCGKLSAGLPRTTGQYPMPYNRTNTGRPKPQPDTGVFPFSSSYLDSPNLPLYSFGYGLSYTSFSYEKLTLDKQSMAKNGSLTVTVTVRNTGDRPGKEAVQLYMRDLVASVVRPVQQLIDYRKIRLEPGEKKDVVFTVTEKQLRFWDFNCNEISEPGDFELSVGCADHLLLTQRFTLKA